MLTREWTTPPRVEPRGGEALWYVFGPVSSRVLGSRNTEAAKETEPTEGQPSVSGRGGSAATTHAAGPPFLPPPFAAAGPSVA
jgi:hypothetical protein